MELRRPKGALNLGDAIPTGLTGDGRAPCTRFCARCGARLRHHNHQPHCAPCHDKLWPWTMPAMRTRTKDECPTCGGLKMRVSTRCKTCSDKQRYPLDFTSHTPL